MKIQAVVIWLMTSYIDVVGNPRECLQAKVNELEINSKTENIRDVHEGINYFRDWLRKRRECQYTSRFQQYFEYVGKLLQLTIKCKD
jgi:hypothetical protein